MTSATEHDTFSVTQAARRLGVPPEVVFDAVTDRTLLAYRTAAGDVVIRREDLLGWQASRSR